MELFNCTVTIINTTEIINSERVLYLIELKQQNFEWPGYKKRICILRFLWVSNGVPLFPPCSVMVTSVSDQVLILFVCCRRNKIVKTSDIIFLFIIDRLIAQFCTATLGIEFAQQTERQDGQIVNLIPVMKWTICIQLYILVCMCNVRPSS